MNYKIQLEIKGIYNEIFTEKNISLGTSIKETLDKTYDMISLEIILTDKIEEYQPHTPVIFIIYESNEDGSLKDSKIYNMIIESDDVEEVYIGRRTKYTHKLVLIEETKALETELMPNITFTQPVMNLSVGSIEFIDSIKYTDVKAQAKTLATSKFNLTHNIPENKMVKNIYSGTNIPNISASIEFGANLGYGGYGHIVIYPYSVKMVNISNNEEYELASPSVINKSCSEKSYGDNIFKIRLSEDSGNLTVPENIPPGNYKIVYKYKIDKITHHIIFRWPFSVYQEDISNDKIKTVLTNKLATPSAVSSFSIYPSYIPENITSLDFINNYSDLELGVFTVSDTKKDINNPIHLDYVLDKIESQIILKDKFILRDSTEVLENNTTKILKIPDGENRHLRITMDMKKIEKSLSSIITTNLKFYNKENELILDKNLKNILLLQPELKTLYIDIDVPKDSVKYMATIESPKYEILEYRNTISASHPPKYVFSDRIKGIASSIVAPEYTFEKKTLWEICLEIGEMFNGIPTLNNGVIDYLILDDKEPVEFKNEKESSSRTSNMTNYATKLYTPELKNIIQDENFNESKTFITFPAPNSWIKVRAAEYYKTSIDRQTSAIVIDNEQSGIYKLKKVLCRYNNKEYDITDYVVEKSIFDSLSSELNKTFVKALATDISEKGTRAYYERGKNIIYNLAQLPENGSLIGWKQDKLTIQYILALKYNIPLSDTSSNIFDYEFRIEYYPYHSRMNISKQTNLNGIYNQATSNFNQTSNNVSALQFSKHAEETLNKLGNAEINLTYTSPEINDGIQIGDCLVLNNRNYYVNQKAITLNNNDKTILLNLTKDNYKQDTRVAVSREYRQYNIDSSNVLRKTLSKSYSVILSTEEIKLSNNTTYIGDNNSSNRRALGKSIVDTLSPGYYGLNKISNAFIHVQNIDGSSLKYNTYRSDVPESSCSNKILPVIGDVLGNTMTFQWDMYDNYSAGRQVRDPNLDTRTWWDNLYITIGNVTFKEKDYGIKIQDDCRYCDDNGGTPSVYTVFFSNNQFELPFGTSSTLPDTGLTQESISQYGESMLSTTFDAYKDSREALSFQITASLQTFDKDIRIFNMFKYNPLVSNSKLDTPKWYGYTEDNIPADNQYYRFNKDYELDIKYNSTRDTSSLTTIIKLLGQNKSNNDYLGYILCYDNGEVLLDIRKPLKSGSWAEVYFNIFNDEISLKDILYIEDTEPVIDIREYSPVIYSDSSGKLFIDLDDFRNKTGLDTSEIKLSLGTLHNTQARGIQGGYHGRKYSKSRNKSKSPYRISNNYKYGDEIFKRIYVNELGEILFDTKTSIGNNIQLYIDQKQISNQDLSVNKKTGLGHVMLKYGITINYKGLTSDVSNLETVNFSQITKLPISKML